MGFIHFLGQLIRFYVWSLVFCLGMVLYLGDKISSVLLGVTGRSEYVRRGSCQRTGQCCKAIGIELPKSWLQRGWVVHFFRWFSRVIHNFHYIGTNGNMLVFECHYLTEGNTCGIYPFRPKICREYPVSSLFGRAKVHKGCGFWFVERSHAGKFGEALSHREHINERAEYLQEVSHEASSYPV